MSAVFGVVSERETVGVIEMEEGQTMYDPPSSEICNRSLPEASRFSR